MLIHSFSTKGGSAKTALATTLASALHALRFRVALVDLDTTNGAHGGATAWSQRAMAHGRPLPFPVMKALPTKPGAFDFVVVDHPPGLTKAHNLPAGLVCIPTPLDPGSFASALKSLDSLRNRNPAPLLVPFRVRLERSEQRRLAGALAGPAISDRAIYASAMGAGASIYTQGAGLLGRASAIAEFDQLVNRILDHVGATSTTQAA